MVGLLDPELWRQAAYQVQPFPDAAANSAYGRTGGLLPGFLPSIPTPFKPKYGVPKAPEVQTPGDDGVEIGQGDGDNDPGGYGGLPPAEGLQSYDTLDGWMNGTFGNLPPWLTGAGKGLLFGGPAGAAMGGLWGAITGGGNPYIAPPTAGAMNSGYAPTPGMQAMPPAGMVEVLSRSPNAANDYADDGDFMGGGAFDFIPVGAAPGQSVEGARTSADGRQTESGGDVGVEQLPDYVEAEDGWYSVDGGETWYRD